MLQSLSSRLFSALRRCNACCTSVRVLSHGGSILPSRGSVCSAACTSHFVVAVAANASITAKEIVEVKVPVSDGEAAVTNVHRQRASDEPTGRRHGEQQLSKIISHTYIYIYIYMHTRYTYIYIYIYTYIYTWENVRTCVYIYGYIYIYIYIYIYVCVCVC